MGAALLLILLQHNNFYFYFYIKDLKIHFQRYCHNISGVVLNWPLYPINFDEDFM